jgi:hypothetical protein
MKGRIQRNDEEVDSDFSDCDGGANDRGNTVSPGWKISLIQHALDDNVFRWPRRDITLGR